MLKKITFATLLLGYACISTAATDSKDNDNCHLNKASCSKPIWHVEIDGLYIGNDVHQSSDLYNGGQVGDQALAYRIEASYYIDTKRDVSLNYSAFNKTTNWLYDEINYSSKSQFKILNLELGQKLNFGQFATARYHIGLQFFKSSDLSIEDDELEYFPKLEGIGPRMGLYVAHELKSGFGIFGDVNLAFLRAKFDDIGEDENVSTHTMAYSTDANIGVYYNKNMANGDLTLRLGWGTKAVDYAGWDYHYVTRNAWSGFFFGAKWVANA